MTQPLPQLQHVSARAMVSEYDSNPISTHTAGRSATMLDSSVASASQNKYVSSAGS